jgi:hypothetical protein
VCSANLRPRPVSSRTMRTGIGMRAALSLNLTAMLGINGGPFGFWIVQSVVHDCAEGTHRHIVEPY